MKTTMKNYLVTGGAGFIGSQLIKKLIKIKKTNIRIYSLDNYSSGLIKNHIKDKNVFFKAIFFYFTYYRLMSIRL